MINTIYVITSVILPPGCFVLLLALSLICWHRRRFAVTLILITLLGIYLLSTPFIAVKLAEPLQPAPIKLQAKAQAIVVLGAGRYVNAPEYGSDIVSRFTLDSCRYAAHLYQKTKLPILTSGGSVYSKRLAEAAMMAKVLQNEFNVPVKWQEINSHNTKQNAFYTAKILRRNNINRVILVTSAMHMARSVYEFKQNNIQVAPAATSYFAIPAFSHEILAWLPNIDYFRYSSKVLHEYLGLIWARI